VRDFLFLGETDLPWLIFTILDLNGSKGRSFDDPLGIE
jgi:hypothetical protein